MAEQQAAVMNGFVNDAWTDAIQLSWNDTFRWLSISWWLRVWLSFNMDEHVNSEQARKQRADRKGRSSAAFKR